MQVVGAEMTRLNDKLVEECSKNIDEKESHLNELISVNSNDYKNESGSSERSSCITCIVLLVIFVIISIGTSCDFFYFCWYLKKATLILLILILAVKQ